MEPGDNHRLRAEVERIVREVLAELTRAGSQSANDKPNGKPNNEPAGAELVVTETVVSFSTLTGRLEGVTRLLVTRGAVLTPSARDELRKRKISIASDLRQ